VRPGAPHWWWVSGCQGACLPGRPPSRKRKLPIRFDAWVRITPDNRVTLILGKSEMGQGIMTALPMILARRALRGLEEREGGAGADESENL